MHAILIFPPSQFDGLYYWSGLKFYDAFARVGATKSFGYKALFPRHTAGMTGLYSSRFLSAEEAVRTFPTLARNGSITSFLDSRV